MPNFSKKMIQNNNYEIKQTIGLKIVMNSISDEKQLLVIYLMFLQFHIFSKEIKFKVINIKKIHIL